MLLPIVHEALKEADGSLVLGMLELEALRQGEVVDEAHALAVHVPSQQSRLQGGNALENGSKKQCTLPFHQSWDQQGAHCRQAEVAVLNMLLYLDATLHS